MEYILFFIVGLVGNIVGTLVGGGGLISLPAMLLMGLPVHSAIGANKVSNTVSSLTSFFVIFKQKEVSGREAMSVIAFCLSGGILGGLIASFLSSDTLTIIAILLLSFAFITSFMGKGNFEGSEPLHVNKKTGPALLGIGIYYGMFGPGSSTLALYLHASQKIAYIRAVGLARIGVFASCFGASITYISTGKIMWPITLCLMLGAVVGAQLGVRLARKLKSNQVQLLLRLVTVLLIVQIVVDYLR